MWWRQRSTIGKLYCYCTDRCMRSVTYVACSCNSEPCHAKWKLWLKSLGLGDIYLSKKLKATYLLLGWTRQPILLIALSKKTHEEVQLWGRHGCGPDEASTCCCSWLLPVRLASLAGQQWQWGRSAAVASWAPVRRDLLSSHLQFLKNMDIFFYRLQCESNIVRHMRAHHLHQFSPFWVEEKDQPSCFWCCCFCTTLMCV